jgi:hypothetical protein
MKRQSQLEIRRFREESSRETEVAGDQERNGYDDVETGRDNAMGGD